MKKIFFAAIVILASSFISAKAGSVNENIDKEIRKQVRKDKREKRRELWLHSVNSITQSQYYNDFPNAKNVTWTQGEFAEAGFYDQDVFETAFYDRDNELVGVTRDVDYSSLPAKAKHYITKKYPGYSVQKIILFEDNESNDTDMFLFNNSFDDEDTYFPVISNGVKKIILRVTADANVSVFQNSK